VQELQTVHGGRDHEAARVPVAGDRAGDVDEVHDRAAEDVAERIRVVGQDDLHHLGGRGGRGDRLEVGHAGIIGDRPRDARPPTDDGRSA
jgi:hypothetical protein